MKALTILQPWASLLGHRIKEYETRSWSTRHRGLVALHAGKAWTQEQVYDLARIASVWPLLIDLGYDWRPIASRGTNFPLGAIVAVAELRSVEPAETLAPRLSERAVCLCLGSFADRHHRHHSNMAVTQRILGGE